MSDDVELTFVSIVETEKVKEEPDDEIEFKSDPAVKAGCKNQTKMDDLRSAVKVKEEPEDEHDFHCNPVKEEPDDEHELPCDQIKKEPDDEHKLSCIQVKEEPDDEHELSCIQVKEEPDDEHELPCDQDDVKPPSTIWLPHYDVSETVEEDNVQVDSTNVMTADTDPLSDAGPSICPGGLPAHGAAVAGDCPPWTPADPEVRTGARAAIRPVGGVVSVNRHEERRRPTLPACAATPPPRAGCSRHGTPSRAPAERVAEKSAVQKRRERQQAYRERHREQLRQREAERCAKQRNSESAERLKVTRKKYREQHREEINQRQNERRRRKRNSNASLNIAAESENLPDLDGTHNLFVDTSERVNDPKKKAYQQTYREKNREAINQRQNERRKRQRN